MDTYELDKRQVFDKTFYRTILTIAMPIALQNLITTLLNMIDTFMISSVSLAAIGGVGAANKIFFLLNLVLFGTNSGASILASQYWGIKDKKNIRRVLGMTLIVGLGFGVIFTILAIFFSEPIISMFTPNEPNVILEGSRYLKIVGISYCFTAITFSYSFIARATHHLKLPTIVTSISILVNTVLNYGLIFGNLGMPELGVEGAAIATVIARIFECITLVTFMYVRRYPSAGSIKELLDLPKVFVSKYINTILPVVLNEFFWALGVTMYAMVYGRMGEVVMASMTITQTMEQLAFIVLIGLSNAGAVMLGNTLGANEKEKAVMYARQFMKMMLVVAVVTSLLLNIISSGIISLYNLDEIVGRNIRNSIFVLSLFLPFKSLNMLIIVGILRSGNDTIAAMLLDMLAVWLVGIPLAVLGGLVFEFDIAIVYAMILCEEVVKLTFSLLRVKTKKWVNNIVA